MTTANVSGLKYTRSYHLQTFRATFSNFGKCSSHAGHRKIDKTRLLEEAFLVLIEAFNKLQHGFLRRILGPVIVDRGRIDRTIYHVWRCLEPATLEALGWSHYTRRYACPCLSSYVHKLETVATQARPL